MYPEKIIGAILQLHSEHVSLRGIIEILKGTWKFKASVYGVWSTIKRDSDKQNDSGSDTTLSNRKIEVDHPS
jgi:hypothetical protein